MDFWGNLYVVPANVTKKIEGSINVRSEMENEVLTNDCNILKCG
jgi:hypothetical protein